MKFRTKIYGDKATLQAMADKIGAKVEKIPMAGHCIHVFTKNPFTFVAANENGSIEYTDEMRRNGKADTFDAFLSMAR